MSEAGDEAWSPPNEAQVACADELVDAILEELGDERGIHAETAVAAAARLGGTFLFRSFGFAIDAEPGAVILSDRANEAGPLLIRTLGLGVDVMGVALDPDQVVWETPADNRPIIDTLETQERLERQVITIADRHGLDRVEAAHACALAAARIIHMTAEVLDPSVAFGLAAMGFVEGSKSMPPRL